MRLRRNPELPMLLKPQDLLPTLRAGLSTEPEALWVYYDGEEKRVFTRSSASELAPVLSASVFLYEPRAALEDRITLVEVVAPSEVWEHLWVRGEGGQPLPSVQTDRLLQAAQASERFPVMPSKEVLWAGLREGARERRWVLRFRGTGLAVGGDELGEWPPAPRLDDTVELWEYESAVDQGFYPRRRGGDRPEVPLTPERVKELCWSAGAEKMDFEELERRARATWPTITRLALERAIREGIERGLWDVWLREGDAVYYTSGDPAPSIGLAGPSMVLVAPGSELAQRLYGLRPGQGPQPVEESGTPREALTRAWDRLAEYPGVRIAGLSLTVLDRDTLENTLAATWVDRPVGAGCQVSLDVSGQRTVEERTETARLEYQGRFEEVRALLAPLWTFKTRGELSLTLTLQLRFDPPVPADDRAMEEYRSALMNANQGSLEVAVRPARRIELEDAG